MRQGTYSADSAFDYGRLPEAITGEPAPQPEPESALEPESAVHVHEWRIGPASTIGRPSPHGGYWKSYYGGVLLDRPVVVFWCADPTCLALMTKDIPDPNPNPVPDDGNSAPSDAHSTPDRRDES